MIDAVRRAFRWTFADRSSGRIVVAQLPNLPLMIFLAARIAEWLFDPAGTARTAAVVVATVSLTWWAVDEIVRGVNPFRRVLGAAVLVSIGAGVWDQVAKSGVPDLTDSARPFGSSQSSCRPSAVRSRK